VSLFVCFRLRTVLEVGRADNHPRLRVRVGPRCVKHRGRMDGNIAQLVPAPPIPENNIDDDDDGITPNKKFKSKVVAPF
jgi:hypothetical protein